jgi:hypothetical protein
VPDAKSAGQAAAKKATAKAATKAAATVAAGGGPEDPVTDAVAAKQVLSATKAKKATPKGATDSRGYATFKGDKKGPGRGHKAVSWAWSGNRQLLTAEFVACIAVLGLGTLLAPDSSKDSDVSRAMVKGSALAGLFLLLSLVATSGKGAARAATALGTLVTVAYVVTSSDVHHVVSWVSKFFDKKSAPDQADSAEAPVPPLPDTGEGAVGGPVSAPGSGTVISI